VREDRTKQEKCKKEAMGHFFYTSHLNTIFLQHAVTLALISVSNSPFFSGDCPTGNSGSYQ
jgi:hypothetical protein